MLIDTHAHLNFDEFRDDYRQVIDRAFEIGVEKIIVPSSDPKNGQRAIEIADQFENVFPAVGAHPLHIKGGFSLISDDGMPPSLLLESYDGSYSQRCQISYFRKLAQYDHVKAIGEIGLDYGSKAYQPIRDREIQITALKAILKNTYQINKPYIFHCRPSKDSDDGLRDLYFILKSFFNGESLKGVIHCFAGSWQWAQKFYQLGFLVSYTGLITLTDRFDRDIEKIPLDSILLETDSPFMAPKKYQGQRCQPAYLVEVAKKIAKIKKISFDKVAQVSTKRAEQLFKI